MTNPSPTPSHACPVIPGGLHWARGVAALARADGRAAIAAFGQATEAAPGDMLYWVNLANAQRGVGQLAPAIATARHALQLEPDHPLALRILGDALARSHRYAESVEAYVALEASGILEPEAMIQHAAMLQALRRPLESVDKLMQAAAIQPDNVLAHALMATSFRDMALQNEAVECLRTVLALDPSNLQALSSLSYERRHVCDWQDLAGDVARLSTALASAPQGLARVASVFALLSLPIAPELLRVAACGEARSAALGVSELPPVDVSARGGARLRVGMLSYDFHEHPVSQLLVEVLEQLDRSGIELLLYSSGRDDGSALRRRIEAAADHFVDVRGLSDRQAAERIRNDGVELLIDLQGHTRGHRLAILAHRPAPVQASFLGYPGTTGAAYIDYLIGDPFVTPLSLAPLYSEKLAQMPLCFQPNGRGRPLPAPMSRAAAGLPEDAFVMCAFNHTYKILPEAFDAWCAVMREQPRAVLWVKETNGQLHDNVRREAAARGVVAERIVFATMVSYPKHFARLALADLFVDSWPYNAHTTASDALWAGVPVVTLYGKGFASRVAASVLNAAGVGELAFETVDDYQRAIIALALEPGLLATYRRHLVEQRMVLPLFDSQGYAQAFAQLLQRMAQRWRDRLAPDHLPAWG